MSASSFAEYALAPALTADAIYTVELLIETVKCAGKEPVSLEKLRAALTSWEIEFRSQKQRHTPSLELDVVDQETFDFYDTKQRFNITGSDLRNLISRH